jgi:CHASE3 domain sensor protein
MFGFGVAIAILIMVMAYARSRVVAVDTATLWVDHTHRVIETIGAVRTQIADAQAGQRAYLLTGERAHLVPYRASLRGVDTSLAQLRALTVDNPVQQHRVDSIQSLSHEVLAELGELTRIAESRGGGNDAPAGRLARAGVSGGDGPHGRR